VKQTLLTAGLILLVGILATEWWAVRLERNALLAVEQYDRSLQQLAEGRWRILAQRVRSERAIRAVLEAEHADMARDLRRARARIASLTSTTITAPPETLLVATSDTFWAQLGIREYRFEFAGAGVHVRVDSVDTALASILYKPVDLVTVVYRRPDRSWWADVELSQPWEVGDLQVKVHDPGPSWWERNDLWIGAGLGAATTAILVYLLKPR